MTNNIIPRLVMIVTMISFATTKSHAGAWALPKGKGQIISTTTYDTAGQAYDDMWKLSRDVSFSKLDSRLFVEHGLTSKLTVVVETAYQDVDYTAREGRSQVSGVGSSSLGLRYQAWDKWGFIGSLQGSYILAGSGENIADADLGRGGNGVELRGLLGRSFKVLDRNAFADIQAAWIYRPDDNPKTYKADVTLGIDVLKKVQFLGQGFYSHTEAQVIGSDRILANDSLKAQISLIWNQSEKTSYQIGVFQTVAGRNIIREKALSVGIWRRY